MTWMEIAYREAGQAEVAGKGANPAILAYFSDSGHAEIKSDEVPWCAAFVGAMLVRAGLPSTQSLMARSYLDYGQKLDAPKEGCIVVLKRGAPPAGHVGFAVKWTDEFVWLLGGNQGNEVKVAAFARDDVLGYRWPPAQAIPVEPKPPAPLAKSGTIWSMIAAAAATVMSALESSVAVLMDAASRFTEYGPIQGMFASLGGNVRAVSTGLVVSAIIYAVSRRVKAGQEGKAG